MATTEVQFSPEDLKAAQSAERIPEPTVVVIFGASGDLTKRKLLPALFHLEQSNLLPEEFAVVGVARRPLQDEFAKDMREGILQFGGVQEGEQKLDEFMAKVSYHAMNFDDPARLQQLEDRSRGHRPEARHQGEPAVLSGDGAGILCRDHRAARRGMAWRSREQGKVRVIIEKPFGHDLDSAPAVERRGEQGLRRRPDLPHRPLPGQGDGAEHPGLPLRQRHLRACVES